MKLERFFSMLAATQSQHCLLTSSQSQGISTYTGSSGCYYYFFKIFLVCQQSWSLPQSLEFFFFLFVLVLVLLYFYKYT